MTHPERNNDGITRRRLLGAAGVAGVGAVATTLPAGMTPAYASGATTADAASDRTSAPASGAAPTVTDLGPAVLGAPIVGATVAGDSGFVVTRGLEPPILAEYDLDTGRVVANHELTTGLGGWGTVSVGGFVYAGMYSVADIHRLNLATGAVERLGRLGNEQFAFDLTASPAGKIYAGTFPGGKVYEIDPTGSGGPVIRDLGQAVPGLQYVRCVAAGPDGTVYAGTGTSARLVAIDPVSGARTDILPASLHSESFVYDVAVSSDHVVAGTEPHGQLAVIDRTNPANNRTVITGERTIDAITIDGHTAYFTARPSGALYAYRLDNGTLTRLAVPVAAEETRGVFVRDGVVHGASGAGLWWTYDVADGEVNVVDLVDVGLQNGPEPPQSVSYSGDGGAGQVLVGGNFGLQVHDLGRKTSRRVRVDGEAKSMTPVRDRTVMAIYPGALVDAYDHQSAKVARIGEIGGLANRPRSMRLHPPGRLLLIGVRNEYGVPGGALAVVDVRSGTIDRYDDLVAGQAVAAVASHRDLAFLGTEIAVDGAPPVAKEAVLAGFDLTTRQVAWTWKAVPGATGYVSLVHHHGLLYGVTAQGVLLVADPVARTVVGSGRIPAGRPGYLTVRAGAVLTVTSEVLARVNPDATTTTLVSGLAGDWYNEPQLAVNEDSGDVFTVRGRNLVRIHFPA
ncbi:SMP-30/gluconolactonase/LRE family protein [Actinopolymorpha singaporensis]|uniref:Outer membrane protein assembly factor BamB, contains PQQ-like beta-propeller repeat n=1 Tax=Actinopolymorpha singaporensis TaxID=117157 RepID=A0A1H1RVN7_9ACTN|nr:PQQ-binding-like beta-propeller repeat protein [Actinopolymorpha singaporensis]SDS39738.1 Outer membrane protein assembly factor BamB, contains PQQ-like beta-propeller repeat [Actinopolymorpha singaporensis]